MCPCLQRPQVCSVIKTKLYRFVNSVPRSVQATYRLFKYYGNIKKQIRCSISVTLREERRGEKINMKINEHLPVILTLKAQTLPQHLCFCINALRWMSSKTIKEHQQNVIHFTFHRMRLMVNEALTQRPLPIYWIKCAILNNFPLITRGVTC